MIVGVTGASGFLGGALCRGLAEAGHDVVAIVRQSSDLWRLAGLNVTLRYADVTDPSTLPAALAGCDWLVHAAGRLGAFGISEAAYNALHVDGTRNVLTAARNAGVARVLYVSSPGVLGPTADKPQNESADYAPSNRYERSKAAAERVARSLASLELPIVIVRPEFVYGPSDLHVLDLFKAVQSGRIFLINQGQSHCHPTYIDDAVNGMLLALENGRSGEVYHIAGHASLPMRNFLRLIAEAVDAKSPSLSLPRPLLRPAAVAAEAIGERINIRPPLTSSAVDFFSTSYRFSLAKAGEQLGYRPKTSIQDGIHQTADWYVQHGHLMADGPHQIQISHSRMTLSHHSVTQLYPYALAEGEGVGTAYEYYVKRRALRKFLATLSPAPKTVLIAGLPEKYGHSSDFFLLAHELGAAVTVIDERSEKIASTQALIKQLQSDGMLTQITPSFELTKSFAHIDCPDRAFDLVVTSEVIQRLPSAEQAAFVNELNRVGQHVAIFCPNGDNASHVGLSGLSGLTLTQLQTLQSHFEMSSTIDMPPFPPGIALSDEQREQAQSGWFQQFAMWGLQQYSLGERLLPARVRKQYAHIVYTFTTNQ